MSHAFKAISAMERERITQYNTFATTAKSQWFSSYTNFVDKKDDFMGQVATITGGWIHTTKYNDNARVLFHTLVFRVLSMGPLLEKPLREPELDKSPVEIAKALGKIEEAKKIEATLLARKRKMDQIRQDRKDQRWKHIKALYMNLILQAVWMGVENCIQYDREKIWAIENNKSQNPGFAIASTFEGGLSSELLKSGPKS